MPNNKPKNPRHGAQPPQMLSRSLASGRARWITGATIPVDWGSKLRAQEMTIKSHDHQKLFSPIQIGPITLSHRVVMAPLTRSRSPFKTIDAPAYKRGSAARIVRNTPVTFVLRTSSNVASEVSSIDPMLPVPVLANNIEVTKLSLIVSKQEVASFQIQHIGVERERIWAKLSLAAAASSVV
jgi:2,4-dienoyl-CoA reductase-like NADH-dependent reductase (Old Yellow Enzyme family)